MPTQAAPIDTWFGIGGGAERYTEPTSTAELLDALRTDPDLRVLGDGANLLVEDEGVRELVVRMRGELASWQLEPTTGVVLVGAGASLPKLILASVRAGLGGLQGLGGVPATIGGALVMNAGGKYGDLGTHVHRVHALTRDAERIELERADLRFAYRHSNLKDLIITGAELRLTAGEDPAALRATLKAVMAEKKRSQPLAARSCGCVFRNPAAQPADLERLETLGLVLPDSPRLPAGLLIDRAGCKGLTPTRPTVRVSNVHANFFETSPDACAADVIELIERVTERVEDRFDITLQPELVIWRRSP